MLGLLVLCFEQSTSSAQFYPLLLGKLRTRKTQQLASATDLNLAVSSTAAADATTCGGLHLLL
jgi:hypothetical protein